MLSQNLKPSEIQHSGVRLDGGQTSNYITDTADGRVESNGHTSIPSLAMALNKPAPLVSQTEPKSGFSLQGQAIY